MPKSKPSPTSKPKWRNIPDDVILRLTPATTGSAESLCPTLSTIHRCISGSPEAQAIVSSYSGCVLPVTIVEVLPCA